jgi:AraC-like DNA-binding protein
LPTDCIDLIINLSNNIIYETDSNKIIAPRIHINGLRDKYSYIHQTGNICVLGISFYSFGLYPFVNKSLESIQNKIIDVAAISTTLAQKLEIAVSSGITEDIIISIEKVLCSELKIKNDCIYNTKIIHDFFESKDEITIKAFCNEYGMNIKTLERMFLRYTGYTPKKLRRIRRFQTTSNQLVHKNNQLLDVVYDNNYVDQAHFIKEFHNFSGKAPLSFLKEKATIKENSKYCYI